MTKTGRKITLGVVVALATLCCAFGVTTLGNHANFYANAEAGTITVDALGNATWTLTDDDGEAITADSYQWSYVVGGTTYGPYVTDDDGANVGEALTRAVKYAQANGVADAIDVTFSVAPVTDGVASTAATITHTITQYVDYGYEMHDITEYTALAQGDGYELGDNNLDAQYRDPTDKGDKNNSGITFPSVMYKNNLLTLGLYRVGRANKAYYTCLGLFGTSTSDSEAATSFKYHVQINNLDNSSVIAKLTKGSTAKIYSNTTIPLALSSNYTKSGAGTAFGGTGTGNTKTYGAETYVKVGVFDVYNLSGTFVGEQFYMDFSVMKANGLAHVGTISEFFATSTYSAYTKTSSLDGMSNVQVDNSGLYVRNAYMKSIVQTGDPNKLTENVNDKYAYLYSDENVATGIYYDNVDGTLNWNKVVGATSYEYAVGNGAYQTVSNNYVNVYNDLVANADIGYTTFKVRAVKNGVAGAVATYTVNTSAFYAKRSAISDIYECATEKFANINDAAATGGISRQLNALKGVNQVNFSFVFDNSTTNQILAQMRLFGTGEESNAKSAVGYTATFSSTQYMVLGLNMSGYNATSRPYDMWWRAVRMSFTNGTRYFVTFGVDDVYNDWYAETPTQKVAERLTLRVSEQDGYGGLKTLFVVSYDNTQCFAEDDANTTIVENAAYVSKTNNVVSMQNVYSGVLFEQGRVQLTLDGKIGVSALPNVVGVHKSKLGDVKMALTYGETTDKVAIGEYVVTSGSDAGLYKFTKYVPAKEIDGKLSLQLYLGDVAGGVSYEYCARTYVEAVQGAEAGTYADDLVALVNALADYCDAAADYFDGGESTFESDAIEGVTKENFTLASALENDNTTVQSINATLFLEDETVIRLYVTADEIPTVTINGSVADVFQKEGSTNVWYVDYSVAGSQLLTNVVFSINGGQVTLTCNATFYGAALDWDNANAELIDVMQALKAYADVANVYFNE